MDQSRNEPKFGVPIADCTLNFYFARKIITNICCIILFQDVNKPPPMLTESDG